MLVGVGHDDGPAQVTWLADKLAGLRLLHGERSVLDEPGAGVLLVSQFTLLGDVRKGRRPTWAAAAPGPVAEPLVDALADALRQRGVTVPTGEFGADMRVHLVGDGPVTLVHRHPVGGAPPERPRDRHRPGRTGHRGPSCRQKRGHDVFPVTLPLTATRSYS